MELALLMLLLALLAVTAVVDKNAIAVARYVNFTFKKVPEISSMSGRTTWNYLRTSITPLVLLGL